jgi:hypothetical protein
VIPVIETVVAFVVVQLSVDDCPAAIGEGLAAKETITGGTAELTTIAVAVTVPPGPIAVSV